MTKVYSINAATGEEELRDMTEADQAHFDQMVNDFEAVKAAKSKAETDKAALLTKLGISAEEAKLLLS